MAELRNPYDQISLHKLLVATLAGGILDGTYKTIEDAEIALEKSRQTMSKRRSSFNSEAAENDERAEQLIHSVRLAPGENSPGN